jgi:arginyl-tRNA synthetase
MIAIESHLKALLIKALAPFGLKVTLEDIVIEKTKDPKFGDYATNVCLKFAKNLSLKPIDLAKQLINQLTDPHIQRVEVAGPGFLNFFVKTETLTAVIEDILRLNTQFGKSQLGQGKRINLEFVSANPTGPMHVAHARAAALGDVIATLLTNVGYKVTREFYVNDAGGQIRNLALSIFMRYRELIGDKVTLPEDGYFGKDIIEIAKEIRQQYGDKIISFDEAFFKKIGVEKQLKRIQEDLILIGVHFDVYRSEQDVRNEGHIERTLKKLGSYLYQDQGATYLKTTSFGDDKDRVLIKSDGQYTYFLPDIAYHQDKLSRNQDQLIDMLGPDHHGYIARMKAALAMLGYPADTLEILVMQLVTLTENGVEVKMSKRTGKGITLRDLVEEVGKDAARYFIAARSYHNPLEFDLDLAKTKSNVNPLYYAQYAHARLQSLLEAGKDIGLELSGNGLDSIEELDLLKHLRLFPQAVNQAAQAREPSVIAQYIQQLASYTHSFYTIRRVIDRDQPKLSAARLALVKASAQVLKNSLAIFGIDALNKM